jgi:hypothetical protein
MADFSVLSWKNSVANKTATMNIATKLNQRTLEQSGLGFLPIRQLGIKCYSDRDPQR